MILRDPSTPSLPTNEWIRPAATKRQDNIVFVLVIGDCSLRSKNVPSFRATHGHWSNDQDMRNTSIPPPPCLPSRSQVSAGYGHSCCVTTEGELYTWGSNRDGCLGLPRATKFATLPQVSLLHVLHVLNRGDKTDSRTIDVVTCVDRVREILLSRCISHFNYRIH